MMVSDDMPAFGVLLKQYRLAAGLTHEALAERSTLSARAISDLERGVTRAPRRDSLGLLTAALRLTAEQQEHLAVAARPSVRGTPAGAGQSLPVAVTSFVGRDHEIERLRAWLSRRETRMVTLTGTGGAGKTRLAVQVARTLLDDFADGTYFVPLAAVADLAGLVLAVAQTLGVAERAGESPEAAIMDALHGRRVLLLLDNLEHLPDAAPWLGRLFVACPRLTMLATSRAPLRLSAEQEFAVLPLPVPDLQQLPPVEALARFAAVTLFVERARRVRADFQLQPENAAAVAAICVRLDGLPLAVELAAARVKLLSPRALLTWMGAAGGSPLHLLTGGAHDLPARQRTLRDTIAWSFDLLPDGERWLFRRLSVFVGGWTLEAAVAICRDRDDAPCPGVAVLDGLASLLDKSLVYQAEEPDGEPRFGMLETIRDYARERLVAAGEQGVARADHARYFLAMVETAGAVLVGAARQPARLAAERDNIHAALRWLVESG